MPETISMCNQGVLLRSKIHNYTADYLDPSILTFTFRYNSFICCSYLSESILRVHLCIKSSCVKGTRQQITMAENDVNDELLDYDEYCIEDPFEHFNVFSSMGQMSLIGKYTFYGHFNHNSVPPQSALGSENWQNSLPPAVFNKIVPINL